MFYLFTYLYTKTDRRGIWHEAAIATLSVAVATFALLQFTGATFLPGARSSIALRRIFHRRSDSAMLGDIFIKGALLYRHICRLLGGFFRGGGDIILWYRPQSAKYKLLQQLLIARPDNRWFRDFSLPHLHSRPPLDGFPSEYCHAVWCRKTRTVWLPDGEKNWRYVYAFWHNARTWRTTQTPHDG